MSDHGWGGGEWPDDLDPDGGGGLGPEAPDLGGGLGPDLGSGLGSDLGSGLGDGFGDGVGDGFGEAETADLGGSEPLAADPPADPFDPPLDPASDSTVDGDFAGPDLDAGGDGLVDTGGSGGGDGPFDGGDGGDGSDGDGGDPGDGGDGGDRGPELTPVGADPDLDPHADAWTDQSFPEPLDLDAPEPVDGFPWTDPATLGTAPLPDADAAYQGAPEATELAAYAGEELPPGTDPWTALSASEDPATSSLARWWSPDA